MPRHSLAQARNEPRTARIFDAAPKFKSKFYDKPKEGLIKANFSDDHPQDDFFSGTFAHPGSITHSSIGLTEMLFPVVFIGKMPTRGAIFVGHANTCAGICVGTHRSCCTPGGHFTYETPSEIASPSGQAKSDGACMDAPKHSKTSLHPSEPPDHPVHQDRLATAPVPRHLAAGVFAAGNLGLCL